jgi:hypothetical protein
MKTFTAYHQCYKDRKATEFAIQQFREYNPDTPYYLLSDNGNDFSDLAEKYNCYYFHDKINTGMNYCSKTQAERLFQRLRECFLITQTEYIILMEDDVLCRKKIDITEDYNLAMSYVPGNKLWLIDTIKKKYNNTPNVDWYGATGGSILNKNLFTNDYNLKTVSRFLNEDYDSVMGSMDQFITTLYVICGYDCSVNPFLGETHRTPNWQNSELALIHCYKEMYS